MSWHQEAVSFPGLSVGITAWGVGGGGGDRTGEMGSGVLGLTSPCLPVEDKLGKAPPRQLEGGG